MYARTLLSAAMRHAQAEYAAAEENGKPLPDRRGLAIFYVRCELHNQRGQRHYDKVWDCYGLLEAMQESPSLASLMRKLREAEQATEQDRPGTVIPGQNQDSGVMISGLKTLADQGPHNNNDSLSVDHQSALANFIAGV